MTTMTTPSTIPTVELRKVKINDRMSEETTCFSAEIWMDGAKAGEVLNRGEGGCNAYRFHTPDLQAAFNAWAAAQPIEFPDFEVEDQAVSALLEAFETGKAVEKLKKRCATKTLFRLGNESAGGYRELPAPIAIGRAHVLKQNPTAEFLNDWTDEALRAFVAPERRS